MEGLPKIGDKFKNNSTKEHSKGFLEQKSISKELKETLLGSETYKMD